MLKKYLHLVRLVFRRQPYTFLSLQFLLLINAFFEIAGIVSITPLLTMLLSPDSIIKSKYYIYLIKMKAFFGVDNDIVLIGFFSFFSIISGTVVSLLSKLVTQKFSLSTGKDLASGLLSYYLNLSYHSHATSKSSFFIKNILQESNRLIAYVLTPLMHINVGIIVLAIVMAFIFFINPMISLSIILALSLGFSVFYLVSRGTLNRNSKRISVYGNDQYVSINQGFAGIKDIKLYGTENLFVEQFSNSTQRLNEALLKNFALNVLPGQIIQMCVFLAIGVAGVCIKVYRIDKFINVTELMFFAVACYKLLPSLNLIYSNITLAKGHISAYDEVIDDLEKSLHFNPKPRREGLPQNISSLSLANVKFSYSDKPIIKSFNYKFDVGGIYGIAGPSGSGKSTLIDVITGLLKPSDGQVYMNGEKLESEELLLDSTSYVSQSCYIMDGTFSDNICFGERVEQQDLNRAQNALVLAGLAEFKLHDSVGEIGKSLSGGQRQRLGIARAIYRNKKLMIFDESTSALDGITENSVMSSILGLGKDRIVIIVAHRLSTLKKCDRILVVDDGQLLQEGSYEELIALKKGLFWDMATKGGFEKEG